jgi:hypothetical protein
LKLHDEKPQALFSTNAALVLHHRRPFGASGGVPLLSEKKISLGVGSFRKLSQTSNFLKLSVQINIRNWTLSEGGRVFPLWQTFSANCISSAIELKSDFFRENLLYFAITPILRVEFQESILSRTILPRWHRFQCQEIVPLSVRDKNAGPTFSM